MAISPTMDDEVAFITGVKSNGTLTQYSYWGWNSDTPATYSSSWTRASKFGGNTAGSAGGTVSYYFNPASNWSATEQTQLASGLAMWAAVANIKFVQTTDSSKAQITFNRGHDGGAYTYTIFSGASGACQNGGTTLGTITSAPISIDPSGCFGPINGNFSNYGGYPIETFLHEEGHALGLGHAGPYNGSVNTATQQYSAFDNRQYSIMSYIDGGAGGKYSSQNPVQGTNWNGNYPTTWMPLDILAIQRLYGVAVNTPLSGGQTFGYNCNVDASIKQYFDFTVNKNPVITLWDKGTGNTFDMSGSSMATTVNLNAGTYSSVKGMKNNIAIAYGTAIDKFVGSTGSNTVTCNNDGDTILGAGGNDIFIGGSGNDYFSGGAGTDIVKYSGARSAYTITTNTDGTTTISGNGAGIDTLTGIETAQFADTSVSLATAAAPPPSSAPGSAKPSSRDFDGNGKGDILLTNAGFAQVQVWTMNGASTMSAATLWGMGSDWTNALTGDFNGDGKTDVLWQNQGANKLQLWIMNGTTKVSTTPFPAAPGTAWSAVATGDFDGNGKADILFQNGSQVAVWQMNGVNQLSSATVGTAPSGFKVIGTADFDGDGKADVLWQNSTTGQLDVWMMNGTTMLSNTVLSSNPGSSWRAVTTGDFNGDGRSDIVLQDTSGQTAIWYMNGTSKIGGGNLSSNLGSNWKLCGGASDYNGDGTTDLLFRNASTGAYQEAFMAGTNILSTATIGTNPGTGWLSVGG